MIRTIYASGQEVDELNKNISKMLISEPVYENEYLLFVNEISPKHTALCRYTNGMSQSVSRNLDFQKIKPKDVLQTVFMDALSKPEISLSVALGSAGTGKTTIALAYALHQYQGSKRKIILTKPTTIVGRSKAFGPVPGDIGDKYAPYLASYEIIFNKIISGYADSMRARGDLEFFPIELTRGCTFENCTLILDEAQNLSWHEMNTLVSRLGENAKMVILGDPYQIDTGVPYRNTGLSLLLEAPAFNASSLTSVVQLEAQYRSKLTQLMGDINQWVMAKQ